MINKKLYSSENIKEKYYTYLETEEWKKISKYLRDSGKCINCGNNSDLVVHHLTYDRVDFLKVGHEYLSDVVIVCRECHNLAHDGKIVFVVIEEEEDYNLFGEILSKSKTECDGKIFICYVKKSNSRLFDIESKNLKKNSRRNKKTRLYVVYRGNYKYDAKDGRTDFPVKKIFYSKADANKYIKNYPKCPWPYLKIKEFTI